MRTRRSARSPSPQPPSSSQQQQQQANEAAQDDGGGAAHIPSPAELLPPELLQKVLALVEDKDRARSCLRVSTAWQQAAAAVSSSIVLWSANPPKLESLLRHLRRHGHHVKNLSFYKETDTTLNLTQPLPCSQLKKLSLSVSLADLPIAVRNMTTLTSLNYSFKDAAGVRGLTALTQLPALQELSCEVRLTTSSEASAQTSVRFPGGVLPKLLVLTKLDLRGFKITEPAVRGLSKLSRLQDLRVYALDHHSASVSYRYEAPDHDECITSKTAAAMFLPHLTSLHLLGVQDISSRNIPGHSTFTALQRLSINTCSTFDAAVLGQMTGLSALDLKDSGVEESALLLAVEQLQQLETFDMRECWPIVALASPSPFSALTASSKLRSWDFVGCRMPAGGFAAMFGVPGRQLTALTRLAFNNYPDNTVGTPELQAITRSCPQLKWLVARGCVQGDADWAVLSQLTSLTNLIASNVSDAGAAKIATLTALDDLIIVPPSTISFFGVQLFSALRRLDMLTVYNNDDEDLVSYFYQNEAPAGSPPDVWQQIRGEGMDMLWW